MINKENDWFLAQSENPEFQVSNFMLAGLTPENTLLREKSFYENNKYILSLYQKDGKFDKATFDVMYNRAAQNFLDFSNNTFKDLLLSDYEYDMYDSTRPIGSKIKKPDIELKKVANPLRLVYGFGGIGSISKPTITVAEAAQKSKIFDWSLLKFLDYTPNDNSLENSFIGFFKSIIEPLVLATYEEGEESIDPNTGLKIKHKKGEYKTNEDGDYYYETLGGRSAYGKQVKSVFDTLTVDGSKLNKYDFFDSDGLDKSVTGTIAKTAAIIAPLFTPLAPYYGYAMVGSQLMDLLPTLYNTVAGNFTDSTIPFFNLIQGIGRSLQGSTSEYSKEHLFSFENFANTVADVALLWQLQRTIADTFRKFSGVEKLLKNALELATIAGFLNALKYGGTLEAIQKSTKAAYEAIFNGKLKPLLDAKNRTAANAALGYMAGLQAFDVYEDTLEQGATKTEAALMAWGAALGMYKVDRTGLGELFFPELEGNARAYRTAINTLRKNLNDAYKSTNTSTRKGMFKLLDKARNASSNYWQNVKDHSLGFFGKSLGEGIEEVSEELVVDFTKSTFNMLTDLGWTSSGKKMDAWENAGDRYLMNFFGGAVGGALFYGVDLVQNGKRSNSDAKEELVYLLRNGNKKELLDEIEIQRKKGKLGSKELSATKYEQGENGLLNYLTASNESDSQNNMIAKLLKDIVEVIDRGIHLEGLDYSDSEIIDKLIMADSRMSSIIEAVGETGVESRVLRDFNKTTSDIIDKLAEIKAYDLNYTDEVRSSTRGNEQEHQEYLQGLSKLKLELLELELRRDSLLSEDASKEYVDKLLFEIDDNVNSPFFIVSFDLFIEAITNKTRFELTKEQLDSLSDAFIKFKESTKDELFDIAYQVFKHFNEKYTDVVNNSANSYDEYSKARQLLWEELIDLLLTNLKFGLAENSDMETISKLFANNFDIDPILKQEYDPRDYSIDPRLQMSEEELNEFEALDESNKLVRFLELLLEAYLEYLQKLLEKFNKLNEIIDKFKQIGFIDSVSKRLLLKAIGNLSLNPSDFSIHNDSLSLILTALSLINVLANPGDEVDTSIIYEPTTIDALTDSSFGEGFSLSSLKDELNLTEIFNLIKAQLFKLNGSNLDQVNSELDNILSQIKLSDYHTDFVLVALKDVNNGEDILSIINNLKSQVKQLAQNIDTQIKNSDEFKIKNKLISEINTVKLNPLYDFLQQIYTEISGKTSNVLDILETLNTQLNQSGLDNFQLNSVQSEEIDVALQALNIVKSLILAASSEELSVNNNFGHNAVYNDFISKLGDTNLYGIVRSDLSYMMLSDLQLIKTQLEYIKQLSNLNSANTLNAQRKTGECLNKVLYTILKPSNEWQNLSQIEIAGIKLFEGVELLETPELDAMLEGESAENLGQLEIDALSNIIANNFLRIIEESGLPIDEVYNNLIDLILNVIKQLELTAQKTTVLDLNTNKFSAYDAAVTLLATCILSKEEFNSDYKQELSSRTEQIIPVYPQEHVIFLATALSKNPTIYNKLLNKIPDTDSLILGNDKLVRLFNTIVIDGVGGAGKSTILSIIKKLLLKYRTKKGVWAVAPKPTSVNNLNVKILADLLYTIDKLFEQILSLEDYAEYLKFKLNHNDDSLLFEYDAVTRSVSLKKDVVFLNINDLGILVLDEYTHLDVASALLLSQLGLKNDIIINYSGDDFQNGYLSNKNGKIIENPNKFSVLTIRTPKLSVSMRVSSIHKNQNLKVLTALLENVDVRLDSININSLNNIVDNILTLCPLLWYSGELEILSGEKLIDAITESQVVQLLETGKKIIYIYDNPNSTTKSLIDTLKTRYTGQIETLMPDEVQGLESEYTIIDVDFSKYDRTKFTDLQEGFKLLYTMITRSLTGTYIINNGLDSFLPTLQFLEYTYYAKTPDFKDKIKELTDKRLQLLDLKIDIPQPVPVRPVTRNGNTKDDVIDAATQLIAKVNSSNVNKLTFLDLINAVLNENELTDVDYDSLISRLLDIEHALENAILANTDLLNRLLDWLYRITILELFEDNSDFIEFLKTRRNSITSSEDYKNLILSLKLLISTAISSLLDISDDTKLIIQSIESDIDAFEIVEDTINPENDSLLEEDNTPNEEPEQLDTFDEKMINSVRVYGFYDRLGNENEDFQLFTKGLDPESTEYKRASKLYGVIRALFTYHDVVEIPTVLLKLVSNEFSDLYDESFPNIFNLVNNLYQNLIDSLGKFKVVISKRTNSDRTVSLSEYNSEYVYRLVYNFGNSEITIGALPDPSVWLASGNDVSRASAYKEFINNYINKITDENPRIEIPIKSLKITKFTNLHKVESYSLTEFLERNPYAIVSPIYISGKDFNRITNNIEIEGSTKGYPIIFATNSRFYVENGELIEITSQNIAELYKKLREGRAFGALVRKIILDPKGLFVTDNLTQTNTARGLFNLMDKINNVNQEDVVEFLSTQSSNTVGIRLLATMWNWRANIKQMLNKTSNLEKNRRYTVGNIVLEPLTDLVHGNFDMRSEVIISSDGKHIVFKNRKMLEAWNSMLDSLIDACCNILGFAQNILLADENLLLTNNSSKILSRLIKNSTMSGTVELGGLKVSFKGGSKVIGTLSKIYSYLTNIGKHDMNISLDDVEGIIRNDSNSPQVTCCSAIIQEFRDHLPLRRPNVSTGAFPIEALNDMFNIIFHGKKYPYRKEELSKLEFSPFPNGVFFHARLKSNEASTSGRVYYEVSLYNTPDLFELNIEVQNPNVYVDIEMDSPEISVLIPESKLNKSEILSETFTTLGISNLELLLKISELYDEAETERRSNIQQTLSEIQDLPISEINEILANRKNPDNHVLYTFRLKLAKFIRTNTFTLMSHLGNNFPIEFNIQTINGLLKINVVRKLSSDISANIVAHPTKGYIYYTTDSGLSFRIDTDNNKMQLVNGNNRSEFLFDIVTTQIPNDSTNQLLALVSIVVNQLRELGISVNSMEDLKKLMTRRTRDPRITRGSDLFRNLTELNNIDIHSCRI